MEINFPMGKYLGNRNIPPLVLICTAGVLDSHGSASGVGFLGFLETLFFLDGTAMLSLENWKISEWWLLSRGCTAEAVSDVANETVDSMTNIAKILLAGWTPR
jgi:hypothetical protein